MLVAFSWVFVALMQQFSPAFFRTVLSLLPDFLKSLVPVPVDFLATRVGQISVLYVHLVTMLVCIGWALGRGSGPVSGEIARETMDLLVSLPVWRVTLVLIPAVVSTVGALLIALSVWLGIALGVATVDLGEDVHLKVFLAGSINLFAMTYCVTGITAFVSSWQNDRWRTIAISGGVVLLALALEVVRRLWSAGRWLTYVNFLAAFRPQELMLIPGTADVAWVCNGSLFAVGTLFFAAGMVIFSYRDIAGRA